MARLIDGKAVAAELREGLKARCAGLAARGITPGLAVILVGDDLASRIYVRNKERACASVGIHTRTFRFPAETAHVFFGKPPDKPPGKPVNVFLDKSTSLD